MKGNRFEVFNRKPAHGGREQWYWRFRSRNSKIMADGSEGYSSPTAARKAARRLVKVLAGVSGVVRVYTLKDHAVIATEIVT